MSTKLPLLLLSCCQLHHESGYIYICYSVKEPGARKTEVSQHHPYTYQALMKLLTPPFKAITRGDVCEVGPHINSQGHGHYSVLMLFTSLRKPPRIQLLGAASYLCLNYRYNWLKFSWSAHVGISYQLPAKCEFRVCLGVIFHLAMSSEPKH